MFIKAKGGVFWKSQVSCRGGYSYSLSKQCVIKVCRWSLTNAGLTIFLRMLIIHLTQFQNKRGFGSVNFKALNFCFNSVYDVFFSFLVTLSRDHILLTETPARSELVHS